ncbi:MAG: hypothetical protein ACLT78_08590 [Escherichia coli]
MDEMGNAAAVADSAAAGAEKEVTRVGGHQLFRWMCGSLAPLTAIWKKICQGQFRRDLFYRQVFTPAAARYASGWRISAAGGKL